MKIDINIDMDMDIDIDIDIDIDVCSSKNIHYHKPNGCNSEHDLEHDSCAGRRAPIVPALTPKQK